MPDGFTIELDTSELFSALDAMVDAVAARTRVADRMTADRIDAEATGRVQRRTGTTAAAIVVEEAHNGEGYVVLVRHPTTPGLGRFLEYGTSRMTKRPFLFASAHLEVGPHERRVSDAVQAGIDDAGLGE